MTRKLTVVFLLIVLVPLVLLAWIGVRIARDEQEQVRQKFRRLMASRLQAAGAEVEKLFRTRERAFLKQTEGLSLTTEDLRTFVRRNPVVLQVIVLDPGARLLHPPPGGQLSQSEQDFLTRAEEVWSDRQTFFRPPEQNAPAPAPSNRKKPWGQYQASPQGPANSAPQKKAVASPQRRYDTSHGWYTWYWGPGVNFLFWRRDDAGNVIGLELNRTRLLADVVAELPESDPADPRLPNGRIALLNAKGGSIYHWGPYEPAKGERPKASLRLRYAPLTAWRMDYFASDKEYGGAFSESMLLNFVLALGAIGVTLVGLAVYFYRESSRELREAAQRVSFVNQVSHELKTPLTNIRMYGELLQDHLPGEDERSGRYVDVIVEQSQRLSRLIGNILTFARGQRDTLKLHPVPGVVDGTVRAVLEHFRPSLEAQGVRVSFEGGAGNTVSFDGDALEQILGNLFANVEKYASGGGAMDVASRQEDAMTIITVADQGPGIPRNWREQVFQPFRRVSNKLTDGVSGTGIGLSIARDLARRHGGDLRLMPSEKGARFELELKTEKTGVME